MAEPKEIAMGVHLLSVHGSNVYFVRSGPQWVLIDTAWMNDGSPIRAAAEALYGANAPPAAILLTHAHADHAGAAPALSRAWEVPVYVHADEIAMLDGAHLLAHPDLLDPIGRVIAFFLRAVPARTRQRILSTPDLAAVVRPLDRAAGVPGLPDWQAILTPGHSPGHLVFFRPSDRVLIAGDAVITMKVTSPVDWFSGRPRLSLLPHMVCWDWQRTKESVGVVADLAPRVLATGHGPPADRPDRRR